MTQYRKIKKDKDTRSKYIFQLIKLIKKELCIKNNKRIFFLGYNKAFHYFLYKNKIIIANWNCQKDDKGDLLIKTMILSCLYVITLLKEYPKTNKDIEFKVIQEDKDRIYTKNAFLNWIDSPSKINEAIDLPYYKIIKFIQNYKQKTFKFDNYIFYSKKDDDLSFTINLYAKNLKNNTKVKLYIFDKYEEDANKNIIQIPPKDLRDIIAIDLGKNLSEYQKRQFKNAFIKFANKNCEELGTKNFFALELIKQTIQPVEYYYGWCVHRIFCKPNKFVNIWVDDFPNKSEEPYFFISDEPLDWNINKIATLNFKSATYHFKDIYKQGLCKWKNWELDKDYINELMEFLKAPILDNKFHNKNYKKYVKTNWQHLIYEYNYNTAGWQDEEDNFISNYEGIEILPFDLPIPDYTKLQNTVNIGGINHAKI